MTASLEKPDDAHPREQAAEHKARIVMRGVWTLYVLGGVLTLAFTLSNNWNQCEGVLSCGFGTLKAFVWMVLWPFFWMFYTNGQG